MGDQELINRYALKERDVRGVYNTLKEVLGDEEAKRQAYGLATQVLDFDGQAAFAASIGFVPSGQQAATDQQQASPDQQASAGTAPVSNEVPEDPLEGFDNPDIPVRQQADRDPTEGGLIAPQDTQDSTLSQIANLPLAVASGFERSFSDIPRAVSIVAGEKDDFMDRLADQIDGAFPEESQALKEATGALGFARDVAYGLGQIAGLVLGTAGTGGVGLAAKGLSKGATVALGKKAGSKIAQSAAAKNIDRLMFAGAAGGAGAGVELAEDYVQTLKDRGIAEEAIDPSEKRRVFLAAASVGALTESALPAKLAKKLQKVAPEVVRNVGDSIIHSTQKGLLRKKATDVAVNATIEGGTEAIQSGLNSVIAQAMYDADPVTFEEIQRSAAVGGTTGALISFMFGRRTRPQGIGEGGIRDKVSTDGLSGTPDTGAVRDPGEQQVMNVISRPAFARSIIEHETIDEVQSALADRTNLQQLFDMTTSFSTAEQKRNVTKVFEMIADPDSDNAAVIKKANQLFGGRETTQGFSNAIGNIFRDDVIVFDPDTQGETGLTHADFIEAIGDPRSAFSQNVGQARGRVITDAVQSGNLDQALTAMSAARRSSKGDTRQRLTAAVNQLKAIKAEGREDIRIRPVSVEREQEIVDSIGNTADSLPSVNSLETLSLRAQGLTGTSLETQLSRMNNSRGFTNEDRALAIKNALVVKQLETRFGTAERTKEYLARAGVDVAALGDQRIALISNSLSDGDSIGEIVNSLRRAPDNLGTDILTREFLPEDTQQKLKQAINSELNRLRRMYDARLREEVTTEDGFLSENDNITDDSLPGQLSSVMKQAGYAPSDIHRLIKGMGYSDIVAEVAQGRAEKPASVTIDPATAEFFTNPDYEPRTATRSSEAVRDTVENNNIDVLVSALQAPTGTVAPVRWVKKYLSPASTAGKVQGGVELLEKNKELIGAKHSAEITAAVKTQQIYDTLAQSSGVEKPTLSAGQNVQIYDYMHGDDTVKLDDDLKPAAELMREEIDAGSVAIGKEVVDLLNWLNEVDPNRSVDTRRIVSTLNKLSSNLGRYMNRTYRAFESPTVYRSLFLRDQQKFDQAVDMAMAEENITDRDHAKGLVENALHDAVNSKDDVSFFTSPNVATMGALAKRKDLPDWLRFTLGEDKDVIVGVHRTLEKQHKIVEAMRMQKSFLDMAIKSGLASTSAYHGYRKIDDTFSNGVSILGDFYVHEDVAEALETLNFNPSRDAGISFFNAMNYAQKKAATVWNVGTHVRNIIGALWYGARSGVNPIDYLNAWQRLSEFKAEADQGKYKAYREFLIRERLLQDSVHADQFTELEKNIDREGVLLTMAPVAQISSVKRGAELIASTSRGIDQFYRNADEAAKLAVFEKEYQDARDHRGMDVDEASRFAASRTRQTMPTPTDSPAIIKKLRSPNTGPAAAASIISSSFLTFSSEVLRNEINNISIAVQDMASPDPAIRKLGIRRAGRTMAVYAAAAAAAGAFEDEDEPLHHKHFERALPPYMRGLAGKYAGIDDSGMYNVSVSEYTQPFTLITNVLNDFSDEGLQGLAESAIDNLQSQFFGGNIMADGLLEMFKKTQGQSDKTLAEVTTDIAEGFIPRTARTAAELFVLSEQLETPEQRERLFNKAASFANLNSYTFEIDEMYRNLGYDLRATKKVFDRRKRDLFLKDTEGFDVREASLELVSAATEALDNAKDMARQAVHLTDALRREREGIAATGEKGTQRIARLGISNKDIVKTIRERSGFRKSVISGLLNAASNGRLDEVSITTDFGGWSFIDSVNQADFLEKEADRDSVLDGDLHDRRRKVLLQRMDEINAFILESQLNLKNRQRN